MRSEVGPVSLRVGGQAASRVRVDWGPVGAGVVTCGCEVAVIVDVLSFTTTVTVAVDRGVAVVPCPWRDERVAALGREHDAVVAVGRSQSARGQVSLSPASVRRAPATMRRLVLPSPNGSTISAALAATGCEVIAASLRNRCAVAQALIEREQQRPGMAVAVIASGERWPDGSLRPAVEDLWGAGAVIAELADARWGGLSPEAHAAAAAWRAVAHDVPRALHGCSSGQELITMGYSDDVDTAAELDSSTSIPELHEGVFATQSPQG